MEEASLVDMADENDIYKLPPDFITQILSFASPQELCNLCQVSKRLKHDSELDSFWNAFLPLNYEDLISEEVLKEFRLKKELFHRLCTGFVLLKGGDRTMSIDKDNSQKTFMIGSREIVFSDFDHSMYWRWVPDDNSRFGGVAELVEGPRFFIRCWVDTSILSPKTTYVAYLVVKHKEIKDGKSSRRNYSFTNAHGELYLGIVPEYFVPLFMSSGEEMGTNVRFAADRDNGWLEVDLGEIYNNDGENGVIQVSIGVMEGLYWLSGLTLEGVELRPQLNRSSN